MILKKAKYYLLASFVCLAFFAEAQKLHLPGEEGTEIAKEPLSLCKPGVLNKSKGKGLLVEYGLNGGYNYKVKNDFIQSQNNSEVDYSNHFKAKIKVPIINATGFKVLAGYEYESEKFHFDEVNGLESNVFESLDGKRLKTNKFTVYTSKSLNEKHYAIFRLRMAYNGDYTAWNDFDNRYATYSAAGIFGVKPNDNLEWGVGLTYSNNPERTRVLPFLIYNRTFNDKWGIESVLPVQIYGRYNVNKDCIVLFGGEYHSKNYSVDLNTNAQALSSTYNFRHAEVLFQTSLEQHLFSWIWLNVKAGYQLPLRSRFNNVTLPDYSFRATPGGQPYVRIGLFLSPSANAIK